MRVLNLTNRRAILAALTAEDGFLDATKIHLFKNDINPSVNNVLADFVEADFTGYAASAALVWGTPYNLASGFAEVAAPGVQFNATGSTITNTVYGYYLTDGAGAVYKYAERFADPVPMTGVGSAIVINPRFQFDGAI